MSKSDTNIPILSPIIFRNNHIQNKADELLNDDGITQFFIHSFKEDDVSLKLPLPPHKKTVNDFVFITNGSMARNLGIESYILKKNDFLFTAKNSITTTELVSSDLEGFFCHFSDEFIGANPFIRLVHAQSSDQNYRQLSQKEADNLNYLLSRIVELYKSQKSTPNSYRLIAFYLSTVIAELFLSLSKPGTLAESNHDVFSNFKNLVHIQFKQNLTIKDYASQLSISPNHLNKCVKKHTGKTASEIIKDITILEAKVLLLQTKMTISEISSELGFNDDSYFSRLFKNKTHNTPTNYRKMIDLS